MTTEQNNMKEIRRTNQRGGECLSIIDLINDDTISTETAAFCWMAIQHGCSFITGAVPTGAGKTTLMAALLGFLPPGEKIVTVKDKTILQQIRNDPPPNPACLLAHEIGEGPWFAYIWGDTAQEFFELNRPDIRPVTCLHADTPDQTRSLLASCGVAQDDIEAIHLHLYIRNFGTADRKHRVTRVDYRAKDDLIPIYALDQDQDRLVRSEDRQYVANLMSQKCSLNQNDVLADWFSYERRLEDLQKDYISAFEDVRQKVLDTYRNGDTSHSQKFH